MPPRLVLIRHGETAWSRAGRHTGRTDLELTTRGEQEARMVTDTLASWVFGAGYTSPLLRARETARIAGYEVTVDDDLVEWDYGDVEGRRHDEIIATSPGWSKWHGVVPGGEQVGEVGERADRFLRRAEAHDADVAVFAHGHLLAVMIARWLGFDAAEGRRFPLATATVSVLGTKRGERVIETLNHRCGPHLAAAASAD